MTTNQTTELRTVSSDAGDTETPSRAKQAVTAARTKATAAGSRAGQAVRSKPKSAGAGLLVVAGATVAAVLLGRRRAAAKAAPSRGRLATLLRR